MAVYQSLETKMVHNQKQLKKIANIIWRIRLQQRPDDHIQQIHAESKNLPNVVKHISVFIENCL